jgi:protein gp37
MAEDTIIAWTDHTFNPWMGCTKVSEGCRNCYAETLTKNRMGLTLWGPAAKRQLTKSPWQKVGEWERAAAKGTPGHYGDAVLHGIENNVGARVPLAATEALDGVSFTPHLVFTGSLMDWAEDRRDLDAHRERMWATIRASRHLWFQMLTKRPENIKNCLPPDWGPHGYDNVWLGTTIEDNRVKARAAHLTSNPARVHFISYEPAIGPGDEIDLTGIEWVICGGESGPGYRPFDQQWARDMRDRCVGGFRVPGSLEEFRAAFPNYTTEDLSIAAGVAGLDPLAFFMKQDAAYRTEINPFLVERDGTKWAWKQYPGKLDPPVQVL